MCLHSLGSARHHSAPLGITRLRSASLCSVRHHSAPFGITRLRSPSLVSVQPLLFLPHLARVASYHGGLSVFLNDRIPVCRRDGLILNTANMRFMDVCGYVFGFARNRKTMEEAKQNPLTWKHARYWHVLPAHCVLQAPRGRFSELRVMSTHDNKIFKK